MTNRSLNQKNGQGQHRKIWALLLAILLVGAFSLSLSVLVVDAAQPSPAAHAPSATITVTTTDDELNGDGDCSLREAIQAANTDTAVDACPAGSGADTIYLGSGTYVISLSGGNENLNATGDYDITSTVTISGVNAATTIVSGGGLDRVFHVTDNSATVSFYGLTISNGEARNNGSHGGGILSNGGTLIIDKSTIRDNMAYRGGGIHSSGLLTITNSAMHGNNAQYTGSGSGVGGCMEQSGFLYMANTTISSNSTGYSTAGCISMYDNSTVVNSTISNNSGGYGIRVAYNYTMTAINTIISTNSPGNCYVFGAGKYASGDYNIVSDSTCNSYGLNGANDLHNTNPLLGTLQDNGGGTWTRELLDNSPAIDYVPMANCSLSVDQRGVSRPQIGACDVGAYERAPLPDLVVRKIVNPTTASANGTPITYTIYVDNSGELTATNVVLTDIIPSGVTVFNVFSSGVTITRTPGITYVWQVQDLPPSASGMLTITGQVDPGQPFGAVINNTATIRTTTFGDKLSNNSSSAAVTILPPDLVINKTVNSAAVQAGGPITYTLAFDNIGANPASNVRITDVVPISVTNTSVVSSGVAVTPVVGTRYAWQVQDLAAGQGGIITITGIVSADLPTGASFANTAVITTTTIDGNPANNSSTAVAGIYPFAEISTGISGVGEGATTAWGDYDNDGDLDILITGYDNTYAPTATIYRNDGGGNFPNIGAGLAGVFYGSGEWGDYDNDGDLDILITGYDNTYAPTATVYRNDGGGSFANIGASLASVYYGSGEWGDYDNDGDLDILITGYDNTYAPTATVYRNDGGGSFVINNGAGLAGVYAGSGTWGDYDNDGDLDILITGYDNTYAPTATVYRNDGSGSFVNIGAGLADVYYGSGEWGDYDNDGDLDILITGYDSNYLPTATVYRNDGSGSFVNVGTGLTGVYDSSGEWGDYDNDGDLDILLTGYDASYLPTTTLYRNDGGGSFVEVGVAGLSGVYSGHGGWADYDNDGDLDVLLVGYDDMYVQTAKLHRNESSVSNTVPAAPSNLNAQVNGSQVTFAWDAAADTETPADGLHYNVRIGTASGISDTLAPMSLNSGYRQIVALGNAQHGLTATYVLTDGLYYWSVQALDTTFAGSPFATEGQFRIGANQAPVAADDAYTGTINSPLTVSSVISGVLGNDSDADGDPFTAVLVQDVAAGALTLNLDGTFTYAPPLNFLGVVTFTYQATDTLDFSNVATVTLTVSCPPDPALSVAICAFIDGSDVSLNWLDNLDAAGGYEVHISTAPYFTPDATTITATLPAGSENYPHVGVIGNLVNYYYYVVPLGCPGCVTPWSNHVGKFEYAIVPGSP